MKMLVWYLWILLLFVLLGNANASRHKEDILFVASQYSYVREATNKNDAPEITQWLKFVRLDNNELLKKGKAGYAYCMAFVSSMIKETYDYHNDKYPFFRNARCSEVWKLAKKDKYTYKTFVAKKVFIGAEKLEPADVAIWSHKKVSEDFSGHTGLVVSQRDNNHFRAIEGNTVGVDGDGQREQTKKNGPKGGVFYKDRTLAMGSFDFPVEGFIRIED